MKGVLLAVPLVIAGEAPCRAEVSSKAGREVAALIAQAPAKGRLEISGWVVRIYFCPSCPAGVTCKPCLGDHLVLSDQRRLLEPGDGLGPSDVLIFADRAALRRLRLRRRYLVECDVRDTQSAGQPINDLGLVASRPRP